MADSAEIEGPFGPANLVFDLPTGDVIAAYRRKCGADIARWFDGIPTLHLFECRSTGYRFWRPASVAGDEAFYAYLSGLWPGYYHEERWEYPLVHRVLPAAGRILEIGCGRGYFLRSIEGRVQNAMGLEFNSEAIAGKVTRFGVVPSTVERLAQEQPHSFDMVCSFQVLEHVADPQAFIAGCVACLKPGGVLALATPNHESAMLANREDAFDMPPHHMGHFTPAVYRKIADLFHLRVAAIHVERRYVATLDTITPATRARLSYRLARRASSILMGLAYRWADEPGNNVLAIMRWPE